MILGGIISPLGMGLLVLSSYKHSLPIFIAVIAVAGVGYGLSFLGGLNLVNANAPTHHRGGTLSAVFLIAYFLQGAVVLLLGAVETAWGSRIAIDLGCAAIAFLSITALLLARSVNQSLRRTQIE
jgi:hypothetical protein